MPKEDPEKGKGKDKTHISGYRFHSRGSKVWAAYAN